jgi:hypothetical protein
MEKKMSESRQNTIIELLHNGYTLSGACHLAGISRRTEYRFRQADEEWQKKVEEAFSARDEIVVESVYEAALRGEFQAQRFWLLNKAGSRWRSEQNVKMEIDTAMPVIVEIAVNG